MNSSSLSQKKLKVNRILVQIDERWIMMGLFGLSLILRLWSLGSRSLWVDEMKIFEKLDSSSYLSMFVKPNFNPPLIYFVVGFLLNLRQDELFLRFWPAAVGAMTVLPVYGLGRLLFNRDVAVIGALLFAISPFHVYYSQEINTYAFATLFSVSATVFFVSLVQGGNSKCLWIGYGVTMVLGLYTHSYFAFLLLAHIVTLPLLWSQEKQRLRAWLITYGVIGILYLPWLHSIFAALALSDDAATWTQYISPNLLTVRTATIAAVAAFYSFVLGMTVEPLLSVIPFILSAALLSVIALFMTWRAPERRSVLFLWIMFALPLALALLIAMTITPIFSNETPRYMLLFLPAFLLLMARGLMLLGSTARLLSLGMLIIVSCLSLYNYYYHWDLYGMGDFRTIAAQIKKAAQPQDIVIHTINPSLTPTRKVATASRRPINYYLGEEWQTYVVIDVDDWNELEPTLIYRDRIWLVFFSDTSMWQVWQEQIGQYRPDYQLPDWTRKLTETGYEQVEMHEYPGRKYVAIYLFQRSDP